MNYHLLDVIITCKPYSLLSLIYPYYHSINVVDPDVHVKESLIIEIVLFLIFLNYHYHLVLVGNVCNLMIYEK